MYTIDDFDKNLAWPLIIRARFAHEIDVFVASSIIREVFRYGSAALTDAVAKAAFAGIAAKQNTAELEDASRLNTLVAMADWEDGICPPWWPWRGPRPHLLDEVGDPIVFRVLEQSVALVKAAGSPQLQKSLIPVLEGRVERG